MINADAMNDSTKLLSDIMRGRMLKLHHHLERPWPQVHSFCSLDSKLSWLDKLIMADSTLLCCPSANDMEKTSANVVLATICKILKHQDELPLTRGQESADHINSLVSGCVCVFHRNESKRGCLTYHSMT